MQVCNKIYAIKQSIHVTYDFIKHDQTVYAVINLYTMNFNAVNTLFVRYLIAYLSIGYTLSIQKYNSRIRVIR